VSGGGTVGRIHKGLSLQKVKHIVDSNDEKDRAQYWSFSDSTRNGEKIVLGDIRVHDSWLHIAIQGMDISPQAAIYGLVSHFGENDTVVRGRIRKGKIHKADICALPVMGVPAFGSGRKGV